MTTLKEYTMRDYAHMHRELKRTRDAHELAMLIRNAAVTENVGSETEPKEQYIYGTLEDFFNYERINEKVWNGLPIEPEDVQNVDTDDVEDEDLDHILNATAQLNNQ
ncbi:hypothetical protein [Salinicoccus sp. HZC-1]|uniref:hypothetical protein n=1 Tax=Salinicoccus sp. HZC-1 TaxID=3385497 RepID=UPI00398B91C7